MKKSYYFWLFLLFLNIPIFSKFLEVNLSWIKSASVRQLDNELKRWEAKGYTLKGKTDRAQKKLEERIQEVMALRAGQSGVNYKKNTMIISKSMMKL